MLLHRSGGREGKVWGCAVIWSNLRHLGQCLRGDACGIPEREVRSVTVIPDLQFRQLMRRRAG
eukprot:scaffold302904_cov22-Tisochrysis_lutea.AAC.1